MKRISITKYFLLLSFVVLALSTLEVSLFYREAWAAQPVQTDDQADLTSTSYTINHCFKNIISQNGQWYDSSYAGYYTVTVAAGQQVNLEMSSADFDSYLVLRDANGSWIDYDNDSAGNENARIERVITKPGTYTVEASQTNRAEGSYILKSNVQLTPTAATSYQNQNPPIYSFNHKFINVTSQNGQWYDSSYAGYYTITAAAGQQVNLEMSSSAFDSYIVLRDPNGSWIDYDNDSAGNGNARIERVITKPGTYTVEASQTNRAEGSYILKSNVQLTPTAATTYQNQNPPICSFNHQFINVSSQNGRWYDSSYAGYYTVTAAAGQQINLEMSSSAFDSYLVLRDPNGSWIDYNNDSAGNGNARIELVITKPGTYTVEASQTNRAEGAYVLKSNVLLTPTTTTAYQNQNPPIYSFNRQLNAASSYGKWYSSNYAAYCTFSAKVGQQINLEMSSTDFDSYLVLRDPNGSWIDYDNDSAGNGNARIERVITSSGIYTVEASQTNKADGNYILKSNVQWLAEDGTLMTPSYNGNVVQVSGPQQVYDFTGASPGDIKADKVTIRADGKKEYSGNVRINEYLKLDGTLLVDPQNLEMSGEGTLYIETSASHFHGQIILFSGKFSLNADTGEILKQAGLDKLEIAGMKVEIKSLRLLANGVKVAGKLKLPAMVGGASIDIDNLQVIDGKVDCAGRIGLPTLKLGKSALGLKNAYMEYDSAKNKFGGHAILEIPKVCGVEGKLGFVNARLDEVGFGLDGMSIAIDATGFFINRLYGEVSGLTQPPLVITGQADISGGPKVFNVAAIEGKDLTITVDVSGSFSGSGKLKLVNFDLASGKFSLDKDKGFNVEANLSALDIVTANLELSIDKSLHMQGSAEGSLHIPHDVPWIGGKEFSQTKLSVNDQGINADLKQGILEMGFWLKWDGQWGVTGRMSLFGAQSCSSQLARSSSIDKEGINGVPGSENVAAEPEIRQAAINTIQIPENQLQAAIRLTWQGEGDADFSLSGPQGESLTPDNCPITSSTANYFKNSEQKEAFYVLANPSAGEWQYTVSNPDIGDYQVEIYQITPAPSLEITTPGQDATASGTVNISWLSDAGSGATLNLYYSSDNQETTGTLIAENLAVTGGSYDWDVSLIPNGQYYIYAILDDGQDDPVAAWAPGRITVVNPNAPSAPNGVKVEAVNGCLNISWDPNSESNLEGYWIYLLDGDSKPLSSNLVSFENNTFEWSGLQTNQTYRLAISAVNDSGLESGLSQSQDVFLPEPAPPSMNINWPQAIGKEVNVSVSGSIEAGATGVLYLDGAEYASGLSGSFLQNVELTCGANHLRIIATNANGDTAVEEHDCYFDPTPPQLVVSNITPEMQVNASSLEVRGSTEPAATLTLNGGQVTLNEDGSFSSQLYLNEGNNPVFLQSLDEAGNCSLFNGIVTYIPPVGNQAPQVWDLRISGNPSSGKPLTGSYSYWDAEGDPEGASQLKWYRSGNSSGTTKQEVLSSNSAVYTTTDDDIGQYLIFEVTPAAGEGASPGAPGQSTAFGPIQEAAVNYGDLNQDGLVDGMDALDILFNEAQLYDSMSAKAKETLPKTPQIADVNEDGTVNGFDALDILFFEAQLEYKMSDAAARTLGA